MEVTLFEFHLEDSPLTAHAPFSGRASAEEEEESGGLFSGSEDESTETEDSGGKLGALLALVLVVGLAVAARRLTGRSSGGPGMGEEPTTAEPPTTE
jgi:hypothetical protein